MLQELVAYGMTNFVTSFFCCYASSAALARTAVLEGTGGRTQVNLLVSAILITDFCCSVKFCM
jgi:MFS superfamily sulfate permease-like transporter